MFAHTQGRAIVLSETEVHLWAISEISGIPIPRFAVAQPPNKTHVMSMMMRLAKAKRISRVPYVSDQEL